MIVEEAARYRAIVSARGAVPVLRMAEDTWVPHFHELCKGALAVARTSQSYIALDAGENWPVKEDNRTRLLSVDGLAVLSGESGQSVVRSG